MGVEKLLIVIVGAAIAMYLFGLPIIVGIPVIVAGVISLMGGGIGKLIGITTVLAGIGVLFMMGPINGGVTIGAGVVMFMDI